MFNKILWESVCIGDVAYEIADRIDKPSESNLKRFVGLEHFDSGELRIRRWGSTETLTSSMKRFQVGDILIARRNVYLKRASLADFDGICSGDAIVLREKDHMITKGFLAFVLNTQKFWQYAIANADGSISKRISVKNLLRYSFKLPPLDEQKRIAELLWAADKVILQNRDILRNLNQIKQIEFDTLTRELCSEKDKVFLGNLIKYASGQVDPKQEPYNKMPLIAPNHIESDTGKLLNVETAEEQCAISGKYVFHKGNIVYSKIRPALNKIIIAEFDGLCSADMYPIMPKDNRLNVRFLYYILTSRLFVNYATRESVRTSIPKLNRNTMSKFQFAYLPLEKQMKYVQELDRLQVAIDSSVERISRTQNMLQQLVNTMIGGDSDV